MDLDSYIKTYPDKYSILSLNANKLFSKAEMINNLYKFLEFHLYNILIRSNYEANNGKYDFIYFFEFIGFTEDLFLFKTHLEIELRQRNFKIKEWNWENKEIRIHISWDFRK